MNKKNSGSKAWIFWAIVLVVGFWYLVLKDDSSIFSPNIFRVLASTSTEIMEDDLKAFANGFASDEDEVVYDINFIPYSLVKNGTESSDFDDFVKRVQYIQTLQVSEVDPEYIKSIYFDGNERAYIQLVSFTAQDVINRYNFKCGHIIDYGV